MTKKSNKKTGTRKSHYPLRRSPDFFKKFDIDKAEHEDFMDLACDFMSMTVHEVFEMFTSLKESSLRGPKWLFLEGDLPPEKRVLLVAHADTVWSGGKRGSYGFRPSVRRHGNIATSSLSSKGIGADDRVGCAMLWALRNSGHSILITDEEEVGCVGARAAAATIPTILSRHCYAIEIDRRGDREFVFYKSTHSEEFEKYLFAYAPDFSSGRGSVTDIEPICEAANICGANFAAGYVNEHRSDELFVLDAWLRTLGVLEDLLSDEGAIRKFEPEIFRWPSSGGVIGPDWKWPKEWGDEPRFPEGKSKPAKKTKGNGAARSGSPHWSERDPSFTILKDEDGKDVVVDLESTANCVLCDSGISPEEIQKRVKNRSPAIEAGWGVSWIYEVCTECVVKWFEEGGDLKGPVPQADGDPTDIDDSDGVIEPNLISEEDLEQLTIINVDDDGNETEVDPSEAMN